MTIVSTISLPTSNISESSRSSRAASHDGSLDMLVPDAR